MKGDVLKTLGLNGSSIQINGGFVKTTNKRMTAVLYSLFSADWVGNMFVTGNAVLGSDFQELHTKTMTIDALLNISASAEDSLDWLVRSGDIKKVAAASRIIDGGYIVTEIEFTELDGALTRFEVWKHPQYWEVRGDI